jgi:biopolymer transport protein ExbD
MTDSLRPSAVDSLDSEGFVVQRRPPLVAADMDITPMIDITFLLLIFFLVATRLDSYGAVELPEAHTGTAVSEKSSVVISIRAAPGGTARIFKGSANDASELQAGDPLGQERELVEFIQSQIRQTPSKTNVLVKAAKEVRQREIMRVAMAVGQIPDIQLHFAVLEIQ